jgi:hypothetical protein
LLVVAIFPNKNHENVPVDAIMTAVFNQEVDEKTINETTMIMSSADELIDGKVIYNPRMHKVIFRPAKTLDKAKSYEMTLTEGVRTSAGLNLLPFKWRFTTES